MRRARAVLIIAVVLLPQLLLPVASRAAQQYSFLIASYEFVSSTGGSVYPGSQGARLTVEAEYYGIKTAHNVHACISLPEGFTVQTRCVEARSSDGRVNTTATYGSILYFYYTVDVDRSVRPGTYRAVVEVKYTVGSTARKDKFPLTLRVSPYPKPELRIRDAWIDPYSYPGTLGATLRIRLANMGEASITGGQGKLVLPSGFKPHIARIDLPQIPSRTGEATITVNNIFISPWVEPRKYHASLRLELTLTTSDGVEYRANETLSVPIVVEEPVEPLIRVAHVAWSQGRIYPGTRSASLEVYLAVLEDYTVSDIEAWLELPPGFTGPNGSRVVYAETSPQEGYGGVFQLSFSPVNAEEVLPGRYNASLRVLLHLSGRGAQTLLWYNTSIPVVVERDTPEELQLVDYGWSGAPISPGTVGGEAYATLEYLGPNTIDKVRAKLVLLDARTRSGGQTIVVGVEGIAATRGSTFTLRFPGIVVPNTTRTVHALLEVEALVRLPGGATAIIERNYTLGITTVEEKPLVLLESHVEYNNAPAHVLPNASNLVLRVTLLNTMPTNIAYIDYQFNTPNGVNPVAITSTCGGGVAAGSTCTITLAFNTTGSLKPGEHPITLGIVYAYSVGGAYTRGRENITIPLVVENPQHYTAKPVIVAWYWGTPGNPSPIAYTGNPRQLVTITIYNPSRWSTTLTGRLKVYNETVEVLDPTAQCSLGAAGLCQLTFSLNTLSAKPGKLLLELLVDYTTTLYGSFTISHKAYNLTARLSSITGQGIGLLATYWQDNHIALPGARKAVLVAVLENRLPWSLQGLDVELQPPPGIKESYSGSLKAHIDGPIPPLSSITASFTLDIENNTLPGNYNATLRVDYWYTASNILVEKHGELRIRIHVDNTSSLVEKIAFYWAQGAPKPGDRGVQLVLVLRAKKPREINNPILEVSLPKGFTNPYTGKTTVKVAPGQPPLPAIPSMGRGISSLQSLLAREAGGAPSPSILYFTFRVNIDPDTAPGVYSARAVLDFMDAWGSEHRVEIPIEILVPGGAQVIAISAKPYTVLVNGTAKLLLAVHNNGSGPVYNLYLFLVPQSPNAYPVKPVTYIPVLPANKTINVSYVLTYSPKSPYGGEVSYTFAGLVGVVYQDSSGSLYRLNATISTIILPPARLVLTDSKAEYRGGVTRVSVSIANLGSMKAERTVLEAWAGEKHAWSLVGEIDPGDEMPAKLEIPGPNPGKVVVRITYYDEYNNRYVYTKTLPVEVVEQTTRTQGKQGEQQLLAPLGGETAIVAAVLVFLLAAFIVIYRYLKQHRVGTEPPLDQL